jgi:glycine betaine/choline ABC-type transport system substrate-binding protein
MRFKEFYSSVKPFKVVVKLQHERALVTTIFFSDSVSNLRKMLTQLFGKSNVVNVSEMMHESLHSDQIQLEATFAAASMQAQQPKLKNTQIHDASVFEGTKTLSPQELQVKSLADKAKQYKDQAKAMKARQQMVKAQQDLMKASRKPNAS